MGEPHYPSLEDELYNIFNLVKFSLNTIIYLKYMYLEQNIILTLHKTYALERLYAKFSWDDRTLICIQLSNSKRFVDNIEEAFSIVDEAITFIADSYIRFK